jgi:hypothetical protein
MAKEAVSLNIVNVILFGFEPFDFQSDDIIDCLRILRDYPSPHPKALSPIIGYLELVQALKQNLHQCGIIGFTLWQYVFHRVIPK